MNQDELWDKATAQLKLNLSELARESTKNPELFCEWLKRLSFESKKLRSLIRQYKALRKKRWEYWADKADPEVYVAEPKHIKVLRQDINRYLNTDPALAVIREQVEEQKALVADLEKIVNAFKARQWDIRNAIEFLKFTQGSNIV